MGGIIDGDTALFNQITMATFDEVFDAVKKWTDNFEEKCFECMDSNQSVFVRAIREQMYSGLKGDGTHITPSYDDDPFFEEPGMWYHGSNRYKAWKGEITPPAPGDMLGLPPRPFDTPNLFINGKFHSEVFSQKGDRQIDIKVDETGDGPDIVGKYGEELLDIGGRATEYFNETYLEPHLQDFFNDCGL